MIDILKQLLSLDAESEVVEYKEAKNQFSIDKLGQYFSALTNEANLKGLDCAWMLFGVKDDKSIVGTAISSKQINNFKLEIANNSSGNLTFIDIYKEKIDGKNILMLKIPASPKGLPIAWKGHYYGRDGESLGPLNIEEIERIRAQKISNDWSGIIIDNATIDDLSEEAIQKAKQLFLVKNPKLKNELDKWDNVKFLNKAKITIKGKITNTSILLLGKPESEYLLSPSVGKISWILRDSDNIEKDYEHFYPPFLLNSEKAFSKIRILKYRYLQEGTIFPDEVNQYEPYIIREALNNAIAHQDYRLNGSIVIIEKEDNTLTFKNKGNFIPETIENVIISDAPEIETRNPFLINAMVNLNMIDTIGSGIKKMFIIQKNKFFPLPEYSFNNREVKVTFSGKVIDMAYAKRLIQDPTLTLEQIIILDKFQKNKQLTQLEIDELKKNKLIEGRKPNYHISIGVAQKSNQKADYIKMRGMDDEYYKELILNYLEKFKNGSRIDLEKLLISKLPDVLLETQKKDKIKNLLQKMKTDNSIELNKNRKWILKI